MKKTFLAVSFLALSLGGCAGTSSTAAFTSEPVEQSDVQWSLVDSVDLEAINSDLEIGKPTVDIGLYYPSNLHPDAVEKLPLSGLVEEFLNAKKVFEPTGVQFKLLWIKTGQVDPQHLAITASNWETDLPSGGYGNMYVQSAIHPTEMSDGAVAAFETIIEPAPENSRTVYLVAMQNVYMPYYEDLDGGRNWAPKVVNTSGLSFPSYTYADTIPDRIRGVITLTKHDATNKLTIAHELGHKLMNVSHEYRDVSPQHEIRSDDGLMLYGSGTQIPSGQEGRWHQERLLLSPYIYRADAAGERVWNADFQAGGVYYDPIYGDYAVQFD
ncbi:MULTISPECIES: hypothetical protein [unclassified Hyphomonas]|jgi:hypothetical protein|uniref:hypothetical protein n=1 Tax=unclassified Hyphomonas TaxID=2630699 RepID=UPI000C4EA2C0|nr:MULTISPECIES: hypothetical protein [unclassified Hyphomonas]MAL48067.1 hypothetical protein [Hyphomonas sp.]MAX85215.1 hypothetical protein [Hyphomonas sp.]HBJ42097.1 hypothetical protein [Hyphomonas sp.]HBT36833.1 hypothetical protein [Hyphomonas sp.]HCX09145.1 hypothetical protein [Hyphomonas sp.]|tara:strand:- start:2114 stop:3091 length:978 start_codon:yes stop_codon:yes gene_type:complete